MRTSHKLPPLSVPTLVMLLTLLLGACASPRGDRAPRVTSVDDRRVAVVDVATRQIGTPYRYGGNRPGGNLSQPVQGVTWHQTQQFCRKLGEQLLANTSLAVGDIATALGYADASGFIRAFERWCGSSPAVWRKENFMRQ